MKTVPKDFKRLSDVVDREIVKKTGNRNKYERKYIREKKFLMPLLYFKQVNKIQTEIVGDYRKKVKLFRKFL